MSHSTTISPSDETSLELLACDDWFAAHASERAELEAEAEYIAWCDARDAEFRAERDARRDPAVVATDAWFGDAA